MRAREICHAWVVYRMTMDKGKVGGNVVCEQREWDAIEAAQPGLHTLLHTGIKTEKEAERLATGTAGDNYRVRASRQPVARPAVNVPPLVGTSPR
ncbi:hypothetical protein [Gemmata palustris]|uniref:hypothetical protein n=1 Tax=Gemmata palustris TaxID=2822762 RepID=UPI001FEA41DB|nr:hypothetical protein [Gemmata palustris]